MDRDDWEDNARPDFLVNPVTGQAMEYDRLYRQGVAFEFNGPQHYGPTEAFPDSRAARMRRAMDAMKIGLSLQHGVTVVVVEARDLTLARMKEKIGGLLPLRVVPADDVVVEYLSRVSARYIRKAEGGRSQRSRSGG